MYMYMYMYMYIFVMLLQRIYFDTNGWFHRTTPPISYIVHLCVHAAHCAQESFTRLYMMYMYFKYSLSFFLDLYVHVHVHV